MSKVQRTYLQSPRGDGGLDQHDQEGVGDGGQARGGVLHPGWYPQV